MSDLAQLLATLQRPSDPLEDLAQASADEREAAGRMADAISVCHAAGCSIASIARAAGLTRQAIHYRIRKDTL